MKKRSPAIFLDRDGTILNEPGYLSDVRKMIFYPGVFDALARLQGVGYKLVVITNQSGVGRGYFTLGALKKINQRFVRIMSAHSVRIDGIYFCPHLPQAGCVCRKPKPTLAQRAARDLNLDLKHSFMIGDQVRDMRLAKNIGVPGLLVLTGSGRRSRAKASRLSAKVTRSLSSAADWILSPPPIK